MPGGKYGILLPIIRYVGADGEFEYSLYEETLKIWQIKKKTDNMRAVDFQEWFEELCKFLSTTFPDKTCVFHMVPTCDWGGVCDRGD